MLIWRDRREVELNRRFSPDIYLGVGEVVDDAGRVVDHAGLMRLRWGDALSDVGLLAMDLERLGRIDLAFAFLDWYWEFTVETHPPSLERRYIAYRALVRAKTGGERGRRPRRPNLPRPMPAPLA